MSWSPERPTLQARGGAACGPRQLGFSFSWDKSSTSVGTHQGAELDLMLLRGPLREDRGPGGKGDNKRRKVRGYSVIAICWELQ